MKAEKIYFNPDEVRATCDLLLVDVPEGANHIQCRIEWDKDGVGFVLTYFTDQWVDIRLPDGDWQILGSGKAGDCTAAQAKEIVEWGRYYDGDPPGMGLTYYYRDYPKELRESCLFNAKESLLSLLTSHGFDPARTVILVKQK